MVVIQRWWFALVAALLMPGAAVFASPGDSVSNRDDPDAAPEKVRKSKGSVGEFGEGVPQAYRPPERRSEITEAQRKLYKELSSLRSAEQRALRNEVQSACPEDDRVRLQGSTAQAYPNRTTCYLKIVDHNDQAWWGTGWFAGPRTVITAGHCVHSGLGGKWVKHVDVIPAYDVIDILGTDETFGYVPYGQQRSHHFYTVKGWTEEGKPNWDFGAVILPDDNLGSRIGWLGIASLSKDELQGRVLRSAGYSSDKIQGSLWYTAAPVTKVEDQRFLYNYSKVGSPSGSPLYTFEDDNLYVVGLQRIGGCPNRAIRINDDVYDLIESWKNLPEP